MLLNEHRNVFDQMRPSSSVTTVDVRRVRSVLNDLLGDSLDCFIRKTNRPCWTLRRCPLAAKSWSRKIPTSDLFQKLFIVCESSNITTGSQSVVSHNCGNEDMMKLVNALFLQVGAFDLVSDWLKMWNCKLCGKPVYFGEKKMFALIASLQFLSVGNRLFLILLTHEYIYISVKK